MGSDYANYMVILLTICFYKWEGEGVMPGRILCVFWENSKWAFYSSSDHLHHLSSSDPPRVSSLSIIQWLALYHFPARGMACHFLYSWGSLFCSIVPPLAGHLAAALR